MRNIINGKYISNYTNIKYIRTHNNHIFIQPSESNIDLISSIVQKDQQHIHVFELYPETIKNIITMMVDKLSTKSKLIIHIPHEFKDYKRLIESWVGDNNKNWKVIPEGKEIKFSFSRDKRLIKLTFSNQHGMMRLGVHLEILSFDLPENKYFDMVLGRKNEGAIRTIPQRNNPELYRDVIIKNFKRSTPDGILKTFNDDDDIWDYIKQTGEWAVDKVDNKKGDANEDI